MLFRDSLSSLLPAPRDDEPATLRQDIVDELSDHLACAYNRELLRGTNADLAYRRVLDRFGDPAAVARRLWLDAMKGKIMAQRVLIATCLVVMLACGASVGLAWNWMNQDRLLRSREAAAAIDANRRLAEALAQSQATNKDMLNKLGEMSEAIRHPVSPDWNPVTFKLTEESASGRPAAGVSLVLTRMEGTTPTVVNRTSDESGTADFGTVRPGDYSYRLIRNWPVGEFIADGEFNVRPGTELHKSIICPKAPPDKLPVLIKCAWPADLETVGLVLYAPFTFIKRSLAPESAWTWNEIWNPKLPEGYGHSPQRSQVTRSLLWGTRGTESYELVDLAGLDLWRPEKAKHVYGDIVERNLRKLIPEHKEVKWEPGTYRLAELMVARPHQGEEVEEMTRRFEILVQTCPAEYGHRVDRGDNHRAWVDSIYSQMASPMYRKKRDATDITLPEEYWSKTVGHFEVRPGQINEWTIPLPDELIAAVRAALKPEPSDETKPAGPAAPPDAR
jgi:hypothetical protein